MNGFCFSKCGELLKHVVSLPPKNEIIMVTFNLELNSKPNRLGKYVVFIRITQDRKSKRIKTSVALESKAEWNPKKQEVRTSNPYYAILNETLRIELAKAEQTYRQMKESGAVSPYSIKEKIKGLEKSESFLEFARQHAQSIYVAGRIPYWKRWVGFCNKLEAYAKDSGMGDITFADISLDFLKRYETYLRSLRNERDGGRNLGANTVHSQLKLFRTLVREGQKSGRFKDNPFDLFSMSSERTVKEKLTKEEIERLVELDLAKGSMKWHCRNAFMFSYYCAGIRVRDILHLRWLNISSDGRLNYQMGKNHKVRDLLLVKQALDILNMYPSDSTVPSDYIFPFMPKESAWSHALQLEDRDALPPEIKLKMDACVTSRTALINKTLKQLAADAGITKKLSMHISRHSFAKAAKMKGIDNLSVKELLAQSSVAVTERYMGDFDTEQNDAALRKVFDEQSDLEKVRELLLALPDSVVESLLMERLGKRNSNN